MAGILCWLLLFGSWDNSHFWKSHVLPLQSNIFPWVHKDFTCRAACSQLSWKGHSFKAVFILFFHTASFMVCFILPIGVRQKDKAKKIGRMVGWGLIPQSLSYAFVMWRLQVLPGISHSKHVVLHLKVPIYQLEYWTVVGGKIREQDFPEMPLVHWSYRGAEIMLIPSPQEGGCQEDVKALQLCLSATGFPPCSN